MAIALALAAALAAPTSAAPRKPKAPKSAPAASTAKVPADSVDAPASHLEIFGTDSTDIAAADSLEAATKSRVVAKFDTTRRRPPSEPTGFERPKWVMARSLVLPGWGQLHNGSWKKATAVAATEGLLIARIIDDKITLNRLERDIAAARAADDATAELIAVSDFNGRSDHYVAHQWWLGALVAYSMLDAYIDAHFRNFGVGFEDDPALPPEERRAAGLKLYWQEHF